MPLLLRKITKPKWFDQPWLAAGEVPADALTDLRTDGNELSVWRVESNKSNLDAVIVALGARYKRLDKLDYVLIDENELAGLAIDVVQSDGDSPHVSANRQWHRDLVQLTAAKLANFAHALKVRERDHTRVDQKALQKLLSAALAAGALERNALDPSLLKQLERGARDHA